MRVTVNALLITLHDPVRLAESIATLDLTSGGRFGIVAGLGYKLEEFAMAGVDRTKRGALAEEYMTVLRQAFTGEPFEWRGRTIVVTPKPTSPTEMLLWAGGSVPASARRAARLRLPFFTMSMDPAIGDLYREACAAEGYEGMFFAPAGPSFTMVSEDPERTWAQIGEYAVYDAGSYATWQTGDHDNPIAMEAGVTVDSLRASGMWQVVTPDECAGARPHLRLGRVAPAHGRHAARARLGEPRAVREQGAAAVLRYRHRTPRASRWPVGWSSSVSERRLFRSARPRAMTFLAPASPCFAWKAPPWTSRRVSRTALSCTTSARSTPRSGSRVWQAEEFLEEDERRWSRLEELGMVSDTQFAAGPPHIEARIEHGTRPMSDRAELLRRLHAHPDDFDATRELRALDADPARTWPRDDRQSDALVRSGLTGIGRLRAKWAMRRKRPSRR